MFNVIKYSISFGESVPKSWVPFGQDSITKRFKVARIYRFDCDSVIIREFLKQNQVPVSRATSLLEYLLQFDTKVKTNMIYAINKSPFVYKSKEESFM